MVFSDLSCCPLLDSACSSLFVGSLSVRIRGYLRSVCLRGVSVLRSPLVAATASDLVVLSSPLGAVSTLYAACFGFDVPLVSFRHRSGSRRFFPCSLLCYAARLGFGVLLCALHVVCVPSTVGCCFSSCVCLWVLSFRCPEAAASPWLFILIQSHLGSMST